tara:strand:- start:84 stop:482 length:399 start_codon:yes stop_codon:yes gene_type:complete
MLLKFSRVIFFITSFVFLCGFVPFTSLLGPGITIASSGNVFKASAQYMIDSTIKKKTGKNSLDFVKDEVRRQNIKKDFKEDFAKLVKERVEITHKKLTEQNEHRVFKKYLKRLIDERFATIQKEISFKKASQ